MRACCLAQDVIVLRPIQNGEVLRLRRGSNPARVTLTPKQYVGRAEIFSPPALGGEHRWGFRIFEHKDEHEHDLSVQNSVHFKSSQTYGAPLTS
jgi:hypothetical protein